MRNLILATAALLAFFIIVDQLRFGGKEDTQLKPMAFKHQL